MLRISYFCFTFVNCNEIRRKPLFFIVIRGMKDRIRHIMESQHMTQQVFAQFIETSPATLCNIFNGRTNPTVNIVGAIKKKIPTINTDWLMFGMGTMYLDAPTHEGNASGSTGQAYDQMIDFDTPPPAVAQQPTSAGQNLNSVINTRQESVREEVKIVDKPQRKVIEIRVFYDDQTWETFVPAKK